MRFVSIWAFFCGTLFFEEENRCDKMKKNRNQTIFPCKNDSFCVSGSKGVTPLAGCGTESHKKEVYIWKF